MLSLATVIHSGQIHSEVEKDEKMGAMKGTREHAGYTLSKHRLQYHGKTVLSKNSSLIPMLLQEFYYSGVGGHFGVFKTYQRASQEFYYHEMKRQIQQYVVSCTICQQQKNLAMSLAGLL